MENTHANYPAEYLAWLKHLEYELNDGYTTVESLCAKHYSVYLDELRKKAQHQVIGAAYRTEVTQDFIGCIEPLNWIDTTQGQMRQQQSLNRYLNRVRSEFANLTAKLEKSPKYARVQKSNGYTVGSTLVWVSPNNKNSTYSVYLFGALPVGGLIGVTQKYASKVHMLALLYAYACEGLESESDCSLANKMESNHIANNSFDFLEDSIAAWNTVTRFNIMTVAQDIIMDNIKNYGQLDTLLQEHLYPRYRY